MGFDDQLVQLQPAEHDQRYRQQLESVLLWPGSLTLEAGRELCRHERTDDLYRWTARERYARRCHFTGSTTSQVATGSWPTTCGAARGTNEIVYLLKDHLGSTGMITTAGGNKCRAFRSTLGVDVETAAPGAVSFSLREDDVHQYDATWIHVARDAGQLVSRAHERACV